MRNQKKSYFFLLILFLSLTSFLSLKTFKKVAVGDIRVNGSKLFTVKDVVKYSSLNFPARLIFINTKYVEKKLKQNLALKDVLITKELFPFGLKFLIHIRTPIALGEKVVKGKKVLGFVDEEGFFINKKFSEKINIDDINIQVFGWQEEFKKRLSEILTFNKDNEIELSKISFSTNGFLTLEEKELKTILLGLNPNLIGSQLQIIVHLKKQLKRNNFSEKIDNVDLTDPNQPKIKVFKP